jgi:RNA polymerase sigma-70 factor (ECF subfamily)
MPLDTAEFERLALQQLDSLYRIARRLTRNPERAEDLVQETYLRALRSRESFELESYGMRPWLVRILQNLHFSKGARDARQPAALEDEYLEAARVEDKPPWAGDGFEAMDERLVAALDRLPEDYRLVMMLWSVEELSYKEIAEACQIPIGTVMSRLHRARQKLAEQLKDYRTEDVSRRE